MGKGRAVVVNKDGGSGDPSVGLRVYPVGSLRTGHPGGYLRGFAFIWKPAFIGKTLAGSFFYSRIMHQARKIHLIAKLVTETFW